MSETSQAQVVVKLGAGRVVGNYALDSAGVFHGALAVPSFSTTGRVTESDSTHDQEAMELQ